MHASSSYSRQAVSGAATTSGGAHSPSRRFPAVSRSIPIAIRRNVSSAGDTTTSDEDDEDNYDDDNRAMGDVRGGSSSKNGLLRAPYLGSLPSNAEFLLSNQHMLLPAASLTRENATTATATAASYSAGMPVGRTGYGSLRESNLMGRFMDGPSSYRERRTGGIVQLRNRGRFDGTSATTGASETTASASNKPNNPISIGDQIMRNARKRQDSIDSSRNDAQQPASSLAAMLESSTLEDPAEVPGTIPADFAAAAAHSVEETPASVFGEVDRADPDVISMSLTGLEVLHSLRNVSGTSAKVGFLASSQVDRQDLEHLPLDANGNNALLSRTFSDPTPQFRRLDQPYPAYHPTRDRISLTSNPPGPTTTTTPGPVSTSTFDSVTIHDATLSSATFAASSIPARAEASVPVWEDILAPPPANDNPDTEGAFEMDLE